MSNPTDLYRNRTFYEIFDVQKKQPPLQYTVNWNHIALFGAVSLGAVIVGAIWLNSQAKKNAEKMREEILSYIKKESTKMIP